MTRRRRTLTALAVVATIVAAVLVAGPGYEAARVQIRSGTAWLASKWTGGAVLVDGASAELAASARVTEPGAELSVAQQGGGALVLDHGTGVLRRVDNATHRVTGSAALLPGSPGLVLKAGQDRVYGVDADTGMVAAADPDTLAGKGEPTQLADAVRPDSVVVDGGGRLWAIDDRTGDLVWLTDGRKQSRPAAAGASHLTVTAGVAALVDPARGTAELLSAETGAVARSVQTGLHATDKVIVGGSTDHSRLLIANPARAELTACDFDTGSCTAPVPVGAPDADLGTPIEVDDHAVVPDYSTGQATIVDLSTSRVVAQGKLFDHPVRFELLARDGIVFYNDPQGSVAGVLSLTGAVQPIAKYTETPSKDDSTTKPDQPAQADQATKVDQRKQKPGLGLPGESGQDPQLNPSARPAAFISVSPATRGAVGDEFELTMVLRQAGSTSVRWLLGDGAEPEGATVRHRWQQAGAFTVRATAAYPGGKTVEAKITVNVDPVDAPPAVHRIDIQRPKPVIGESVHFSADTGGKPDKWMWTVTKLGQPTPEVTARTPEFDHRFATAGKYIVSLTISRGTRTAESSRQFTVGLGMVRGWGIDGDDPALQFPPSVSSGVMAIDAGRAHSLALKSDGSVEAWGYPPGEEVKIPPQARSGVVAISAGFDHDLALKDDGSVLAWGFDTAEDETNVPLEAQHDVVAISAGYHFSAALKSDGSVISWGLDPKAGNEIPRPAELDSGVVAISAGSGQLMALKEDGTVVFWGRETCYPDKPVRDVRAISTGTGACVVLSRNGSVTEIYRDFPWTTPPVAASGIVAIDAEFSYGLALTAQGSVVGWDINSSGDQATVPKRYTRGVLAMATGDNFSLVLLEDPE